ncbi:MAG TPA: glycosyltransferase family 2 protein [Candidatus Paceibacterota bacterium]
MTILQAERQLVFFPQASFPIPISKPAAADYLFRPELESFKRAFYPETIFLALACVGFLGGSALLFYLIFGIPVLVFFSGLLACFYLGLMIFKLLVVQRGLARPFLQVSKSDLEALRKEDLPVYTILIPLYQEAKVIPQIMEAMGAIDYPKEKLDIIITLEEYDEETRMAIEKANPPAHFKILILPNVEPKTKPKALNVAFPYAKGEFLVIYDAEIIPDIDQLKKAYYAFQRHPEVACLQTRLDHYNQNQNLLTRLFNIEFNFYYDLFLPGLQQFGCPMPLSGHSTHFRKSALEDVGAWDPYNVAEDCDMGIALYRKGYRTEILDSQSKEEATTTVSSWMRQRSRWMKGFSQSSIVHMRHPLLFKDEIGGWKNFLAFFLTVPGTVLLNFCNLFYWILLVGWFTTHSVFIQDLFAGPIISISLISAIGGSSLFVYMNAVAAYRRKKYELVKYSLLFPLYWILLALATVRAVVQIFTSPHQWDKTVHGTHISKKV